MSKFKLGSKVYLLNHPTPSGYDFGEVVGFDSQENEYQVDPLTDYSFDGGPVWLAESELQAFDEELNSNTKTTNPKDAIGSQKIPLHLWPTTATVYGSMALLDGACKYGRNNWRAMGVRATVYIDAAMRHLIRYASGEETDPDSGLPQLAMVLACVAILVDAKEAGKLNDDREYPGGLVQLIDRMTPEVARIKERYKNKTPHHYSVADSPASDSSEFTNSVESFLDRNY